MGTSLSFAASASISERTDTSMRSTLIFGYSAASAASVSGV